MFTVDNIESLICMVRGRRDHGQDVKTICKDIRRLYVVSHDILFFACKAAEVLDNASY